MPYSVNLKRGVSFVLAALFIPAFSAAGCGKEPDSIAKLKALPIAGELVWKHDLDGGNAVAFSPDGKLLCVGYSATDREKLVSLWEVDGPRHIADLDGHDEDVLAVAFSPDGRLLATGGRDWTVRIWEVATRKTLHVMTLKEGSVKDIAFSADSSQVACTSFTQLFVWDSRSGERLRICEVQGRAEAVVHSGKHDKWIVGDFSGRITIFDGKTGKQVFAEPPIRKGIINAISSSSAGDTFLTADSDHSEVTIWSFDGMRPVEVCRFHHPDREGWCHAVLTNDGKEAIAAFADLKVGTLVLDGATGTPSGRIPYSPYKVFVSPKKGHCLLLGDRGEALLWNLHGRS